MRIGYVRVSTTDQNPARQREELEKQGIEKWYEEKISGKNTDREQFKLMMDFAREGDEIYVLDFSRLSRSVTDLLETIRVLEEKKVKLVSLKESFDTGTATGKLMLTMIAAINEFERANLLERQREGIAIAKREGKYKGRRPKELDSFPEVYQEWKNGKITATASCRLLNISRSTFYARVKAMEDT